jgi:hypothetical protein
MDLHRPQGNYLQVKPMWFYFKGIRRFWRHHEQSSCYLSALRIVWLLRCIPVVRLSVSTAINLFCTYSTARWQSTADKATWCVRGSLKKTSKFRMFSEWRIWNVLSVLGPINRSFELKVVFSFHFHSGRPITRPMCCYWTANLCSHSCPFVSCDVTSFSGCSHIFGHVGFLQSVSGVTVGDKKSFIPATVPDQPCGPTRLTFNS